MKNTASLVLTFFLASSLAWAATTSSTTQGILTSVTGKVQIKGKDGKKPRTAKKDSTVVEGERIVTDPDAKATLQLFDGSELNISPKTDFQLTKMQKPSGDDKILQFKLFVGRLFAKVKKLSSSKSSFEVEAGGVVCGVRGTQFAMDYDPGKNKVGLGVYEGSVYTNCNGHHNIFHAGENADWTNGNLNGNKGGNQPPGPPAGQESGNKGTNLGPTWNQGGINGIGTGGNDGNDALSDLGNHFGPGINGGKNNTINGGGRGLVIQIQVPPGETVP